MGRGGQHFPHFWTDNRWNTPHSVLPTMLLVDDDYERAGLLRQTGGLRGYAWKQHPDDQANINKEYTPYRCGYASRSSRPMSAGGNGLRSTVGHSGSYRRGTLYNGGRVRSSLDDSAYGSIYDSYYPSGYVPGLNGSYTQSYQNEMQDKMLSRKFGGESKVPWRGSGTIGEKVCDRRVRYHAAPLKESYTDAYRLPFSQRSYAVQVGKEPRQSV
mmetsp:Transcript_7102/g.8198  ORF Transcript_7102/g.8198 Transcript_7102/m.8198 type:complete len:214 (+) Transcript_7102:209-850(+)|eukprot:CAMPEP_0197851322 /NCGR_PEP_ID=MMETSP1438-20131217/17824_1 /TAXON_ID=1461541 /ORGANISM="Pterosperma sp., Strain CCMP1384" /LENGTH=213 /DNA_ID=CAMNT_0043464891 /DNA_START=204 /DNA_END=845 /DNA_ORIENTATION=+